MALLKHLHTVGDSCFLFLRLHNCDALGDSLLELLQGFGVVVLEEEAILCLLKRHALRFVLLLWRGFFVFLLLGGILILLLRGKLVFFLLILGWCRTVSCWSRKGYPRLLILVLNVRLRLGVERRGIRG